MEWIWHNVAAGDPQPNDPHREYCWNCGGMTDWESGSRSTGEGMWDRERYKHCAQCGQDTNPPEDAPDTCLTCRSPNMTHVRDYHNERGEPNTKETVCNDCGSPSYEHYPGMPRKPVVYEGQDGERYVDCPCGNQVGLWNGWANPCGKCNREYSGSGGLLAPRSQWGVETGEDFSGPDINYDMMWGTANDPNLRQPMPEEEDVPKRDPGEPFGFKLME
jgi:hypothetical protein